MVTADTLRKAASAGRRRNIALVKLATGNCTFEKIKRKAQASGAEDPEAVAAAAVVRHKKKKTGAKKS